MGRELSTGGGAQLAGRYATRGDALLPAQGGAADRDLFFVTPDTVKRGP